MDISSIKPAERLIEIVHPGTEEPLGIKVSLVSLSDERTAKVRRKIQDERIRLEMRRQFFKAEDIEENEDTLLFNAMTGWHWEGDVTFEGQKPDFNVANVKKVFKHFPWFKQQIMEAVGEEKAFFTT